MKIGILTHYMASSHGALLQMYAMKKVLENMGNDVYILTFNRNFDLVDEKTKKRFNPNLKNLPYYLTSYSKNNGLFSLPYQFKKQKLLNTFKSKNFKFLPYTDSNKLDCVVVGADEVFSLENGINMMMYGHGITSKRIISYAPSAGQTDVERIKKYGFAELVKSGLLKFDKLSARDEGTKRIISEFTGKDVPIVCDPAILYKFNNNDNNDNDKNNTNNTNKYIVVYSYQSNFKDPERIKEIKKYAKENKLELWSVGVYFKWCDKQINCDPLEMIDIFSKAKLIITDTFHGTITSYIARTPMAIFVRNNNNVKLDHLLSILGLKNRKVTDISNFREVADMSLDFEQVDNNVSKLREEGMKYLNNAIKGD